MRDVQCVTQHGDFAAFLFGEGEPAFELRIQLGFAIQVHRAVQQRARTGDPHIVPKTFFGQLQLRQGVFQVTAPHVATVDQSQRQHFVGRQAIQNPVQLVLSTHQINVQPFHRQADRQTEVVFQPAEVSRHQFFQGRVLKNVIRTFESVFPGLRQVQRQDRLVDLHPLHPLLSQARKDLCVHRQQVFQQVEFVERVAFGLAQPQIRQRTDDDGLDLVAQRQRFIDFLKQFVPAQLEALSRREFRDQVVIVGVEPLGQFLSVLALAVFAAAAAVAGATGHGEQGVQGRAAVVVQRVGETRRDRPEGQ